MSQINARTILTPIGLLAKKQPVGKEDAADIELRVMLHFDAAKRGLGPAAGHNYLARHLVMAQYMASRLKSQPFHQQVIAAGEALRKAGLRPTKLLDLTTGEHATIAKAFKTYFRALPQFEVGALHEAGKIADKLFS